MNKVYLGIHILIFFILASCEPGGENASNGENNGAEVITSGIQNGVNISALEGNDLGEIVVGSERRKILVEVFNNSNHKIKDFKTTFDESSLMGMGFYDSEKDKGDFPGENGTCSREMERKSKCVLEFTFNPNKTGDFQQQIFFSYKTLLNTENKTLSFKAKTGEEASLIFTRGSTFHNLGIEERTEPQLREVFLEVTNKGGLKAKNLKISLEGNTSPSAFIITENTCPKILSVNESCDITVGYMSLNTKPFDEDILYSANVKMDYIVDGVDKVGALNSTFNFYSYQIQGRFETNTPSVVFTPNIINGNKDVKVFKLTNTGYREGIVKEFHFYDASDTLKAKCLKKGNDEFLLCNDNEGDPLTLADFPFKVKDMDSCIENETSGGDESSVGDSCFFELTFWPSNEFTEAKDFTGYTINTVYDSRYKGSELLKNTKMFDITANSVTGAKIVVDKVTFASGQVSNIGGEEQSLFDLGRVALITSSAYSNPVSIIIKNVGESIATVTGIEDGGANAITTVMNDLSLYYQDAQHDCSILGPNSTCEIKFKLSPVFQNDSDLENSYMFDVSPNVVSSSLERYKQFFISYNNEALYNDDGTLKSDSRSEVQLSADLIQKGYLVYANTNTDEGDVGNLISGESTKYHVLLENVGTGAIPYIKIDDINNLTSSTNPFPFEIIADTPPAGADLDCFDIIDFDNSGLGVTPNATKQLPQGKTCSLTIKYEMGILDRKLDNHYLHQFRRHVLRSENNTNSAWSYQNFLGIGYPISFHYYDGDTTNSAPDLVNYGNQYSLDDFQINASFNSKAEIIAIEPAPVTSAIIYRPEIQYPTLVDGFEFLTGFTENEEWINQEAEGTDYSPVLRSDQSIPYLGGLINDTYEYTFHGGTFIFDGSTKYTMSFGIENQTNTKASIQNIKITSGGSSFKLITGGAVPTDNIALGNLERRVLVLEYTPSNSGLDTGELEVEYDNGLEVVTIKIRLMAESIDNATSPPDISVEYDGFQVSFDGNNTSESLKGNPESINTILNTYDSGELIEVEAIRNSPVYAKKRIYINNNSASASIEDIEINLLESPDKYLAKESGEGISFSSKANCIGVTLGVGGNCWFDIRFLASDSTQSSIMRFLKISYKIKSNQYVAKFIRMQFDSKEPAELIVAGLNSEQVVDENNFNRTSYPIDYGNFSNPNHIKVSSYPTNKTITKEVQNEAALKASFLPMISGPVPAGDPVEIYNANDTFITASRACLFGDDEFDGGIPAEEKGFNNTTVSKCLVNITFQAYEKYVGKEIVIKENVIPLEFYNNARNSTDFLRIHLKGFIEPDHLTSDIASYEDVEAWEDGSVTFNWGNLSEANPVWGSLSGLRIFYSEFESELKNINDTSAFTIDLSPTDTYVEISGLSPGRFYYLKVGGVRTKGGVNYNSELNMDILKIVVPPSGTIYLHENFSVIDRSLLSVVGNRDDMFTECGKNYYELSKNGAVENFYKKPVDSEVMDFLYTDPDQGSYSTYSDYNISVFSHHLSDSLVDIVPIFTPYGYSTSVTSDSISELNTYYIKPCDNVSCEDLYQIRGGDGTLVPPGALLYNDGEVTAFSRCFSELGGSP